MALMIFFNAVSAYASYFLAIYLILISVYRILLHPLRNYPGPFLAKISDFFAVYYSYRARLHLKTRQDHLKYGSVIRQGPNKLVFNSAKALHDIYDSDRVQKSEVYLATLLSSHPNVFNVTEKQAHRTKRRLIGNVLSERSMRAFEPTMLEQINIFIEQLRLSSRTSSPVNMTGRSKCLSLDVVGHLAFGYSLKLQTEETNRSMIGTIKGGSHRLNTYMQYPLLAKLHLEYIVNLLLMMKKGSYIQILQAMIKSRLGEDKHAKHDMFSIVIDSMKTSDGDILSLSEIWSEALFFFPAGGESVSTTICGLLFYLSRNPHAYKKLAKEIRSTFKTDSEIRGGPQLSGCQYLRACIDEALRMSPPIPGALWRERSSTDDRAQPFVIDGHVIPEGTVFSVNTYALHHNEEYFPDSFTFMPERWLPSCTSEGQRKAMHDAFTAFSIGARGCAGKSMAYLETSLVMAKILWHFDFEKAPGKIGDVGGGTGSTREINGRERKEEYQIEDLFTAGHDGPNLVFRPRH